jgi:hypothetical protein
MRRSWIAIIVVSACVHARTPAIVPLIPLPASVELRADERFTLASDSAIEIAGDRTELRRVADYLSDLLAPALGAKLAIRPAGSAPRARTIRLEVRGVASSSDEAYELEITRDGIRIAGASASGVFYAVQTLRQLLPASVELRGGDRRAMSVPIGRIADRPRYAWRGAMLDVARHFFATSDVKRYLDLLALYKLNRLHVHLSDDQGWRIEIAKRPNLTTIGGSTQVNGGAGGFYTRAEWADLVAYAKDRFIELVPEIDMPSHVTAAMASYPELACDGIAPPLYTGTEVGLGNLCPDREVTFAFLDDVIAGRRRSDARALRAYRRRRGDQDVCRRVRALHAARAGDRRAARQARDRVGRDRAHAVARDDRRAAVAAGPGDPDPAGHANNPVAGELALPRHEVRRAHRARTGLGRLYRHRQAVRVGPGAAAPRRR